MQTFWSACKDFWNDEDGLGTLEILLIIAVLVVVALMFRERIMGWVESLLDFGDDSINRFQSGH